MQQSPAEDLLFYGFQLVSFRDFQTPLELTTLLAPLDSFQGS